jgi:hypothetical protein
VRLPICKRHAFYFTRQDPSALEAAARRSLRGLQTIYFARHAGPARESETIRIVSDAIDFPQLAP